MIEGPWGAPRIYPEMQGMLDNPEAAFAKLREMGKGLFGAGGAGLNSGGLGAAIGGLLGGGQSTAATPGTGQAGKPNDPLGGQLGETIGNLLQQGLSGLGQSNPPQGGTAQGAPRPGSQRSIPIEGSTAQPQTPAPAQAAPAPPGAPAGVTVFANAIIK